MPQPEHPPLKRHEALAPLSRDHYTGLVQAQRLMKAADGDEVARRKAVAGFVDAWEHELAEHFADEERLLVGLMTDDDRQRLLSDHRQLTDDAARLRGLRRITDPSPSALREVGQRLEQHIRWEERELFGRLQQQATDDQLAGLQEATAAIERTRPRNIRRAD
jgi:iron-sulfur cluster repair protein YtfE (RIC family)